MISNLLGTRAALFFSKSNLAATKLEQDILRRFTSQPVAHWFYLVLFACFAGALIAILQRQDINYDLANYHAYVGFALLNGRSFTDVVPGSIVSYLNPAAYVPFYFLTKFFSPRIAGGTLGAIHGLCFVLAAAICWQATRQYKRRLPLTVAATLISLASPIALSEFGTSFSDISTSILILCSVLLLSVHRQKEASSDFPILFLSGLLVGLATGLKLTNGAYAIGIVIAAMIGDRAWFVRAIITGIAAAIGFLLAAGYWHYEVWRHFGNPLFPFYNAIFRADGFPPVSIRDDKFIPNNVFAALTLPWQWGHSGLHPGAEIPFRDLRYAILLYLLIPLSIAGIIANRIMRSVAGSEPASIFQKRLIVLSVVSIVLLTIQFDISRYLIAFEFLTGAVVISILPRYLSEQTILQATILISAVAILTGSAANWGRTSYQKDNWYSIYLPPELRSDSILFLNDRMSYSIPYFSAGSRAIYLDPYFFPLDPDVKSPLVTTIRSTLQAYAGYPARLILSSYPTPDTRRLLGEYGFDFSGRCWGGNNEVVQIAVCDLKTAAASNSSALVVTSGERIDVQSLRSVLSGNWTWPGDIVWALEPGDNTMTFKLDRSFENRGVLISLESALPRPTEMTNSEVAVTDLKNHEVARLRFEIGSLTKEFCIPASDDRPSQLGFHFVGINPKSTAELGLNANAKKISFGIRTLTVSAVAQVDCPVQGQTNAN